MVKQKFLFFSCLSSASLAPSYHKHYHLSLGYYKKIYIIFSPTKPKDNYSALYSIYRALIFTYTILWRFLHINT